MRYAAIKNERISLISTEPFENKKINIVEIPDKLDHISAKQLIINGRVKNGEVIYKHLKKPASEMKIALVSNYGSACGIGTYSKFLFEEIINYVGDYKLFIEKQDKYEIENPKIPSDKIMACWKRGESNLELVEAIKEYEPDVVLIMHEFGIWPTAPIWLSLISQLSNYRIITTMHSIFPYHQDKTIYEAATPEIVVHLQGAKDCLVNEKKISGKVYVIPHGCYPIGDQSKLWNTYKSNHTFIQTGFNFPYKNYKSSILATAILKKKYPDIFFTALLSESPHNMDGHTLHFNQLSELVNQLGIQDNVSLIRGFQSENVINSYLRTNQVGVFPYMSVPGHEVFGSSGAARWAMSAGLPIISSSIHHFSDLPTIKANSPEEIATALDYLFSSEDARKQQIDKQNQFISDHSWNKIAQQYIKIFEN